MSGREILSLQFGHYSNFIGTHLWNIQESSFQYTNTDEKNEINHDVLYREGFTLKGDVTFTPRLLLVDLKGSLKTLPEKGNLYDAPSDPSKLDVLWSDEACKVQTTEKIDKNAFQKDVESLPPEIVTKKSYNFDDDVKVWSDFLYTKFHPRTVNIIKEYQHESDTQSFNTFPLGTSVWKTEQFEEEFCDKIRNYIEECDSLQGFHVTLDSIDAFAGLSSSCIEYLTDEYEHKSILAFPVIPSHYTDYNYETDEEKYKSGIKDSIRVINLALCYNSLSENSSLFVPLCTGSTGWRQPGPKREFYHTNYNHHLPYHSSAILASAIDTLTLKYRLKSDGYSLSNLCADFNGDGCKVAAASICLPFSFNKDAYLIDCLDNWEGPLSKIITPNCVLGTDKLKQMITLRGINEKRLKKTSDKAGKQKDLAAYKCNTINEMLSLYLSSSYFLTASNVTVVEKGLSVKIPYPKIFDSYVGVDGNITANPRSDDSGVEVVPVLAGLHRGSGIGGMLESLHTETRKIKFPRFQQFINAGLEKDEFNECLDKLFDLRECYEENYYL